jgi:putative ABC transport system substrate-binding protein
LTSADEPLIGKRLQLLTQALPSSSRVALLWDPRLSAYYPGRWIEEPARALGIELLSLQVDGPDELDSVFQAAVREHADALYVRVSPMLITHRAQVAALAAEYGLPSMYELDVAVRAGGLMAYMGSIPEMHRRAAYFVDRILKGAKPADLPVEQPMTFDFIVNMKTAQALGVTFPHEILLQITEVIQ